LVSSRFQVGYPVSALFSYRFAGISDADQPLRVFPFPMNATGYNPNLTQNY
jgi:hypothetical protein